MVAPIRGTYIRGLSWFFMSLFVCSINDATTKFLEASLSPLQVIFGRFFFGTLILLPFVYRDPSVFKTKCLGANCLRGLVLFIGMFIWCYGLDASQLSVACLINFSTPMFILLLASLLLKEKIGKPRIIATIFGFCGVAIVLNPRTASFSVPVASLFLLSALFFAFLDILNKRLVTQESMLGSLFFTGLFTLLFATTTLSCLSAPSASFRNIFLLNNNLPLLIWLGAGADLLFFCILKALQNIDVSAIAPLRYIELLFASLFGYLFFGERISENVLLGSIIIIPSMIYLVRYETQQSDKGRSQNSKTVACC